MDMIRNTKILVSMTRRFHVALTSCLGGAQCRPEESERLGLASAHCYTLKRRTGKEVIQVIYVSPSFPQANFSYLQARLHVGWRQLLGRCPDVLTLGQVQEKRTCFGYHILTARKLSESDAQNRNLDLKSELTGEISD